MLRKRMKTWIAVIAILSFVVGPTFGHTKYRYNPAGQPRRKRVHHVHRQGDARAKEGRQVNAPDCLHATARMVEGTLEFVGDVVRPVLKLGKSSSDSGK